MKLNKKVMVFNKFIAMLQILVGSVNVVFWGIGGTGAWLDKDIDFTDWWLVMILCALAGWMLYCGIKRLRMENKARNYANVIGDTAMISISDIAGSVRVAESQVEKDFQWLIKKNFLVDAYIDYDDHALIFREAYGKLMEQKAREERARKNIVYLSVSCKCCNGITQIEKGKSGTCSYCGAPIGIAK